MLTHSLIANKWSSLHVWSNRKVAEYDAAHDPAMLKDMENGGKFRDVEEDAFQKRVDKMLQVQEVDPTDKSMGAYMKRFR